MACNNSSSSNNNFASLLYNLLPNSSQSKLNHILQQQLQTHSDEPLLNSQDCRITVAEIESHALKIEHFNEEYDQIEIDLKKLHADLQTLNEFDTREIEKKLAKICSDINLYQMKVNEYGDVAVPEILSLQAIRKISEDVNNLRELVNLWRNKGSLYEGIKNFQNDHLRNSVNKKEEQLNQLTCALASKVETRRSLN